MHRRTGENAEDIRARVMARIHEHPDEINIEESSEAIGSTPLYFAYIMDDEELVRLLLQNGAVTTPPTNRSFTHDRLLENVSPNPYIDELIRNASKVQAVRLHNK